MGRRNVTEKKSEKDALNSIKKFLSILTGCIGPVEKGTRGNQLFTWKLAIKMDCSVYTQ